MRKVAVTGGISCGKSTVCRLLKEYGACTVDADEMVRDFLTQENEIGQKVIKLLGPSIIVNNQINKKKIADIVFANPSLLKELEHILHPAVRKKINDDYNKAQSKRSYKFFVAEIPLLFEAKMEKDFDTVITVIASEETARNRSKNSEEFDRRMRFQLPAAAKATAATYVIQNQGDLAHLKREVTALVPQLL